MEEKRYVYARESGNFAELRSASHWCEQCVIFVDAMMNKVEAYATYNGDVQRLEESSASGCHMCGMILDRCKPDQEDFYIKLTGKADGDLCMQVLDPFSREGQSLMFRRQHCGQPPPNQADPQAENGTGSIWHNMLARHWLSSCQSRHYRCNDQPISTFLPSRLLSLKSSNEGVFLQLCNMRDLTKTPTAEARLAYCTLSHRWGQEQPLKLTRDLYESFQQDVPFEDLPKTFADAAQITLNLGISYLWIDSLCICQDDRDDWLAESVKMGDIYVNGICNIAALDPGGCYFDGPTPATKALYFSTREKHYLTIKSSKPSLVGDWLKNTPLGKRGWVFQEIVLSPRTLFYGVDGISWSCIQEVADEVRSMHCHSMYSKAATTYKSVFAHSRTTGIGTFPKMDTGQSYRTWPELVSVYTDTVLTYDSDKWLAISGLAARYMRVSDRRIAAGLDEDRLLEELGWWSKNPAGRVMNGAPTWSWLCCRSSIGMYAHKQDQMLATMITLPGKQLVALTWHTVHSSSTSAQPNCYPIRISGHVRPFCYTAQEGRWNESFDAKFQTYSVEAENERIWIDLPLEDGTTIWGVPLSWTLPFDPKLTMILIVPSHYKQDCWERVGTCSALAYGVGKWDNPRDKEDFLHAFGPVKELTII